MNNFNPKKLLNSKWTAVKPINKEKHFIVVRVDTDDDTQVIDCVIEAVMSKRQSHVSWRSLQDTENWRQGWK